MILEIEDIAAIAHNANRVYCQRTGDFSQPLWEEAPQWQKDSAIAGVQAYINDPTITPEKSHEGWMALKEQEGWVYGEAKDPERKQHPCMLPYDQLPPEQKIKDSLFLAIVTATIPLLKK
jgi:hypothetical protein